MPAALVAIVCDEPSARRAAMVAMLERECVTVETVEGAEATLERLRLSPGPVDLVIVNVALGVEDGLLLVRRMRADAGLRDAAVLVIGDVPDEPFCQRVCEAGADDLLRCDAAPSEWLLRVRALLRTRASIRMNEAQQAQVRALTEQLEAAVSESTSRLEESRQQMLQAQKMESVGRLAGGVAHDFNNLLTSIICFTRFVVDEMSPSDPRRADLVEVLKSADSATRLTRQLLAFSRRSPIKASVLDVNAAVANVDRVLRRTLGGQVELVILPVDEPLCTLIDPGQFDQLVFNLALNARDAMPGGGTITLRMGRQSVGPGVSLRPGQYVELSCSDTGQGMAPEVASRVFDPFFTTKGDKGTGLGLATCYGIVERAGGRISLSTSIGEGTTFTVLLPRVQDEAKLDPRRSGGILDLGLSGTVLVVEDQPAILHTMTRALEAAGLSVLGASSAEDALSVLDANGKWVDLLVTDVMLPGMSGITLAQKLRTRAAGLPVLFVSGYASDAPEQDLRDDMHTAFLPKPFSGHQLVMRAAALLSDQSPH